MPRKALLPAAASALVLIALGAAAGDNGQRPFRGSARLIPTEEVPVLSSVASGRFRATIDPVNQTITYEVSYEGLEGPVTASHIHIGKRHTNGGISVFLCANPELVTIPAPPVPPPPLCPASPATVTGVLTPANIIGPNGQGVAPAASGVNEFGELVDMLRRELTYANVHSSKFPAGEVRGQIRIDHKH